MRLEFLTQNDTVKVGTDGRVYIDSNTSGQSVFLEVAPSVGAVHSDSGFEDPTLAAYEDFFATGATAVTSSTVLTFSGERSAQVDIGSGGGAQMFLSDTFAVNGGDRVEFATFAVSTIGSPKIQLGILTGASGTPNPVTPATYTYNGNTLAAVPVDWTMFRRTAEVPSGHTVACLFWRIEPTATEAVRVNLDSSTSSIVAADSLTTAWAALPLITGFGPVTDWAGPEYRRTSDELLTRGLSSWTGGSPVAAGSVITSTALAEQFRPAFNKVIADSYIPAPPAVATVGTTVYLRPDGHMVTTAAIPVNATLNFDGKRIDVTA